MRISSRLLRTAIALIVLVTMAGCDDAAPETTASVAPETTTATTSPVSTTAAPEPATATTEQTTTTSIGMQTADIVIEQLGPTSGEGGAPIWVRSNDTFDRGRQYWLGTLGSEFVLLSYRWPAFDLAVQRSVDGVQWDDPKRVTGSPPAAEPWHWMHDPFSSSAIAASDPGLIAVFEVPSEDGDNTRIKQVYTSSNGAGWALEPLPTIEGLTPDGGPFAVAAGPEGFAVWATADERRPRSAVLFVRPSAGDWLTVDLPARGNAWGGWVTPAQDDFLARAATDPEARVGSHPVFRVDIAGNVAWDAVPSDSPPIDWNDDLLTTTPYNNVPQPTLYWGPEGSIWFRLPTPDFSTDDEEQFWETDTYTAGAPGITLAGCNCGDHWGFLAEGMVTIEVPKNGYHVTVWGNDVTVDGVWDHPIRYDSRSWFDEANGTLEVPDPDTGETIVTVTCDEMRASAREKEYGSELLGPPPQDLLFSPDGTTWHHEEVTLLFGEGSYVHQAVTLGDVVALLVDPTGDAPTPDPPGCPLGIYPEVRPFEIWVATPGS